MKLTTRGFTLVELMIVIAIIGILAATLFPSLTSYLARGRDTGRVSGIKEYTTAIAAYMLDHSNVAPAPEGTSSTCVPVNTLGTGKYLQKTPIDPISARNHCGDANGHYGYATGAVNGLDTIAVSAILENSNAGNTGTITAYQGGAKTILGDVDTFTKGYGSGYVVRN